MGTVAGATRSVNLPSAPVRQTAPAEVVQVTEVGPPLPAESAPATRSQAPMAAVGLGGGLSGGFGGVTYGAPGVGSAYGGSLGGVGVTTSLGGGLGGAVTTMAAPVTVAAPAITTSLGGGFGGAGVYGSTMAAPMMTEVVAAPAITTMAAPVTMAAPMVTEVIATTMATPLATTYG